MELAEKLQHSARPEKFFGIFANYLYGNYV